VKFKRKNNINRNSIICSLIYFEKLIKKIFQKHRLDIDSFYVYLIVCIVISCKMNEDSYLNNLDYVDIFEFEKIANIETFNNIEVMILKILKYNLFISNDVFENFLKENGSKYKNQIEKNLFCFPLNSIESNSIM
jgi:hypothetical protein